MITRQQNWLGQQRVDVPHIRALESSAAADMDLLAGQILAGLKPRVVAGFTCSGTVGQPATSVQVSVAGGALLHPTASDAGTIFSPAVGRVLETLNTTNPRVSGNFAAGAVNYVGVDLRRAADAGTVDLVQFIDADTNLEEPETVPLARTLDYVFVVSTQDFTAQVGVCPVAKVTTDAANNVLSVIDARDGMFRLGSGGSAPDPLAVYGWPGGRTEVGDDSDFTAGDKAISSFRDWLAAAMSRLWEVGGGEHWYSPTADRNVKLMRTGSPMASSDWFTWDGTNLTWQGLRLAFDNSTAAYNTVADQTAPRADLTDLTDGQCVYVDVQRSTDAAVLTAHKGTLKTLGTPAVPGSRYVVAWCLGTTVYARDSAFAVGVLAAAATVSALGTVKLSYAAGDPANPTVAPRDVNGMISNIASGGNVNGLSGTGNGSGYGVYGTGGATGSGVYGVGGASGGSGVVGAGTSGGAGVSGTGNGAGQGGLFTGGSGGLGVQASGGVGSNRAGIYAQGDGTAEGVTGQGGAGGAAGVRGIGGANGVGVVGAGAGSGAGGDFTGGATGSAVVAHGVASSSTPQGIFKDSGGNNRWLIDHNGYPLGRIGTWVEDWQLCVYSTGSPVNSSGAAGILGSQVPGWYYDCEATDSTVTLAVGAMSDGAPAGGSTGLSLATIHFSAANSTSSYLYPLGYLFNAGWANLCATVEWYGQGSVSNACEFFCGLNGNSANSGSTFWGKFTGSTGAGRALDGVWFTTVGGNWVGAAVNGGTQTLTAAGPAFNSLQIYAFKIELYGSGNPGGARANFYIDGTLVGTITTNLPTHILKFAFGGLTTAAGSSGTWLGAGGIRAVWNLNDLSIPAL